MLIVSGDPSDESRHNDFCKQFRLGVSFSGAWKGERSHEIRESSTGRRLSSVGGSSAASAVRPSSSSFGVVGVGGGKGKGKGKAARSGKVVEIRGSDPVAWWRKVASVKQIVDKERGFVDDFGECDADADDCDDDGGGEGDEAPDEATLAKKLKGCGRTAFLYVNGDSRVVGLVVAERIERGYRIVTFEEDEGNVAGDDKGKGVGKGVVVGGGGKHKLQLPLSRELTPRLARVGVHQVWVHASERRRGVASAIIDVVRAKLIFGTVVPVEEVAFSSPTGDGLTLGKRYVGEGVLVYDV